MNFVNKQNQGNKRECTYCMPCAYNCAVSRARGFISRMTCECQFNEESSALGARAELELAKAAAARTMEESAAASAAAALPAGLLNNFWARSCKFDWHENDGKSGMKDAPAGVLARPSHPRAPEPGRTQRVAFWGQ